MNGAVQDEIRRLEEKLGAPEVRASAEMLSGLVSDEFVEFGPAGQVYTKRDVVSQMLAAPKVTLTFIDFRVLAVSPDVALATYRTGKSLRSSLWRREGPGWRIIFHQGSPLVANP